MLLLHLLKKNPSAYKVIPFPNPLLITQILLSLFKLRRVGWGEAGMGGVCARFSLEQ